MNGGRGNDTYDIAEGSTNVISDRSGCDTVNLPGNRCDYDMDRQGDDMVITSKDGKTKVTIKDHYSGKGAESINFADDHHHDHGHDHASMGDGGWRSAV
ncbi:MAG: hypothetical protein ACR2QF_06825 [Geminicoccaceae bacterium]